jgi:hypothetical protein
MNFPLQSEKDWNEWQRLTPQQRWNESMKLWEIYLAMGGALGPDYDPQSPFNEDYYPSASAADDPEIVYMNLEDEANSNRR